MRPICTKCSRFLKPKKTGFYFIEGFPETVPACGAIEEHTARPGLSEAQHWKPYKLWAGDLYECPGCGAQVISGAAAKPVAEHYEPDFADQVKSCNAKFQLNDC